MKRLVSLLLLFSILAASASLFACQGPAGLGGGGGDKPLDVEFLDHLDDYGDSMDFSSQDEFVISHLEDFSYEVYGDEKSNEKLDTLIYNRNRLLESRFGVSIDTDAGINNYGGTVQYDYVQLSLNSGDVSFDVAAMISGQAGKLIFGNGGNLLDFRSEVPYCRDSIKAGEEWWPREINTASTVMGRQFVAVSDFSVTAVQMALAVIFNKDLARSTNVVSGIDPDKYDLNATFYDVVRGNDWTIEEMKDIVKDFWRDNPNVGRKGERDAEDRFGMVAPIWTDADAFAYAFGYHFVTNDGVSAPTLWEWDGSQYDAIVSLRELFYSNGAWTDPSCQYLADRAAFFAQEDRVLFELNTLGSLGYDVIHEMEQDFGVLPYPKYDRDQAQYYTGSADNYTVLAVPFTALWDLERLRMTGALIEALSAENCNSVKKPYYDDIVTHHNVTDGDSAEMIGLIMAGRVYDLSAYHYDELTLDTTPFTTLFRYLIRNKNQDIVQFWQSNSGPLSLQMDDLVRKYLSVFADA